MTDIGAPMTDFFYQMKAKKFYVTDACIGCGKCAKICVNNNITLVDKNLYGLCILYTGLSGCSYTI